MLVACTGPPESDWLPSTDLEPVQEFEYLHVSDAAPEPEPPLAIVGRANPGCPRLRVFADAEDLCRHGIMPMSPLGECHRLLETSDPYESEAEFDPDISSARADRVELPALRGRVELFARHYQRSQTYYTRDEFFLALRSAKGHVLLASIGEYHSHFNDIPEFERFVGDSASVEITTRQSGLWHRDGDIVRDVGYATTRCTLEPDGALRCNGECPTLALAREPKPLDCAALANLDDAALSDGQALEDEDYWDDEDSQSEVAAQWLGVELDSGPATVRFIELKHRTLTVLEVVPGKWVLLDARVPLLASDQLIRVGAGPGGIYASTWSNGARRLHRLLLDTHDIEPVLPGACG